MVKTLEKLELSLWNKGVAESMIDFFEIIKMKKGLSFADHMIKDVWTKPHAEHKAFRVSFLSFLMLFITQWPRFILEI